MWDTEFTDEFYSDFWEGLTLSEQEDVAATVRLLAARGVTLGFPKSSGVKGSKHSHMRELRVQSGGQAIRVFYAFDPRRAAILLIGGIKTSGRFYEEMIPKADKLYDEYLAELKREGLIKDESDCVETVPEARSYDGWTPQV